jgi:flagellar protein FliS
MSTYAPSSLAAYRQQSVLTATPGQLVVMLYDGARRFLAQAAAAMREGERRRADERLRRAEAILDELINTLDLDAGEIAHNLQGIYLFCRSELLAARGELEADRVEWVSSQLGELRESWAALAAA